MTGDESRKLTVGSRVYWRDDVIDAGMVTEVTWSSVVIKWDNRGPQTIMHNDMVDVSSDH